MDKIEINLIQLIKHNLNINEYLTMCKVRYIMEDIHLPFVTSDNFIDSLVIKGYLINQDGGISLTQKANKLFASVGELTDDHFNKLFNLYPAVTPSGRVLHSKNREIMGSLTRDYQVLSKKYLKAVKSIEEHDEIMQAVRTMITDHKNRGALNFLPKLETFINQRGWENYIGVSILEVTSCKNVEKL